MSQFGFDAPNSEPWMRFWNSVTSASEIGSGVVSAMLPSAGDDDGARLADRGHGLSDVLAA